MPLDRGLDCGDDKAWYLVHNSNANTSNNASNNTINRPCLAWWFMGFQLAPLIPPKHYYS